MIRGANSVRTAGRAVSARAARHIWGATQQLDTLAIPLEVDSPAPPFVGATPTKITVLSNGLKVASSDLVAPCTTVGVYVDSGSVNDTISGTSHLLQHMAFKSTEGMSTIAMVRGAEAIGATASATSARETIVYQMDTLKEHVPEALDMLAETILAPKFLPWELKEVAQAVSIELEEFSKLKQMLVQEMAHPAAFGGSSPLGKPLMCPPRNLSAITPEVLASYVSERLTPDKLVVTAAGYDHDQLVSHAKAIFGGLAPGKPMATPPSNYEGGEMRTSADEDLTHFALAFKGCGWKDEALVPFCVLNTLMGGGSSFSAGGPGKGMYTRLYQNILNQHGYVQEASVFNAFYKETGLFGIYGAAPPEAMGILVSAVCDEFKKLSAAITDEELSRAKNQLKSSLLMNLEQRQILFEDIGRQVVTYGERVPAEKLVAQIDAVKASELTSLAAKMLKSPPSIVAYGDTTSVPRYDVIAKQFA
ncbi:hypothetical protein AB1Y20_007074 [Prymnesium parvum]|uniref:Mitochondrial-processing peptidase subunit alpha n=1 Tax=Prymnesium parvum TaxID=97485 RepID=A0AB34J273_PRYPA